MLKNFTKKVSRLCSKILLTRCDFVNAYCNVQCLEIESRKHRPPLTYPSKRFLREKYAYVVYFNSITVDNQHIHLANKVTPLWNLTYEEQLNLKEKHCRRVLDTIITRSKVPNMSYQFDRVLPSPVIYAYRNKDDFNVRQGVDGNPKTIGFLIGKHKFKKCVCVPPTNISIIKEIHKEVAQVYQDFIRLSNLPASYETSHSGHWKNLIVRSTEAGEILVSVTVNPLGFSEEVIRQEQQLLKDYFQKRLPKISLFHQACPHTTCSEKQAPYNLLYGKPYLTEKIKDYRFKISPNSFFQINTRGAELLYDTVIKMAKFTPKTTLLDLCSGTGTISILASQYVRGAVGIEAVPESVSDAIYNAKRNNVENVYFRSGSVEEKLYPVLKRLNKSSDIVAVLNPGRAGLRTDVIQTVRRFTQITRLIYISCKPDSPDALTNFVRLCTNSTSKYPPFKLTKAVAVDMFPMTEHVELVLLFQR